MDLNTFLRLRGFSLTAIAEAVCSALSLGNEDCLFVSGSLVEGLGTPTSDLDLYLLTRRQDFSYHSMTDITFTFNECVLDIRVLQHDEAEKLARRFRARKVTPRNPRAAFEFTPDERKFMHSIAIGEPLRGSEVLDRFKLEFDRVSLARHKLDWSRHLASTFLIDIVGFLEAGDGLSAFFATQELLALTFDALLAASGVINPNAKWRTRFLQELPADWEAGLPGRSSGLTASERYVQLYNQVASNDLISVRDHALEVSALFRRVVPWAEIKLYNDGHNRRRELAQSRPELPGALLPQLAINVDIILERDRLWIVKLHSDSRPFEVSIEDLDLLAFFDGKSGIREVAHVVAAKTGFEAAFHRLETLSSMVRREALEATVPSIDLALEHLLRPST